MTAKPILYGMTGGQWRTLTALVTAAFAFGTGLSLGAPLLSLVLEQRGISSTWIGINTAIAGLSAFIITPFVAAITRRLSATGALVGALLAAAMLFPLFYVITSFPAWFPLRLGYSFALTFIFVLTEFWISALVPAERRGLIMGIYATLLAAGFAVGPVLLKLIGVGGILPFAVGSAILAVSAFPVLMAGRAAPTVDESPEQSVLGFIFTVPESTLAALVFGAVEYGSMAILPLYGLRLGLDEGTATLLVAVAAAGNIVFQVPIGLLSDRISKITLMLGCALVGATGALLIPMVAGNLPLMLGVFFVWGGTISGLYTAGIIHLGARFTGADLVTANATFGMMYSAGMLLGPSTIGLALDLWPPHGAMWMMAGFFAVYLLLLLGRAIRAAMQTPPARV